MVVVNAELVSHVLAKPQWLINELPLHLSHLKETRLRSNEDKMLFYAMLPLRIKFSEDIHMVYFINAAIKKYETYSKPYTLRESMRLSQLEESLTPELREAYRFYADITFALERTHLSEKVKAWIQIAGGRQRYGAVLAHSRLVFERVL